MNVRDCDNRSDFEINKMHHSAQPPIFSFIIYLLPQKNAQLSSSFHCLSFNILLYHILSEVIRFSTCFLAMIRRYALIWTWCIQEQIFIPLLRNSYLFCSPVDRWVCTDIPTDTARKCWEEDTVVPIFAELHTPDFWNAADAVGEISPMSRSKRYKTARLSWQTPGWIVAAG